MWFLSLSPNNRPSLPKTLACQVESQRWSLRTTRFQTAAWPCDNYWPTSLSWGLFRSDEFKTLIFLPRHPRTWCFLFLFLKRFHYAWCILHCPVKPGRLFYWCSFNALCMLRCTDSQTLKWNSEIYSAFAFFIRVTWFYTDSSGIPTRNLPTFCGRLRIINAKNKTGQLSTKGSQ